MSNPIKIGITGAAGRMGRANIRAIYERTDMIVAKAFDHVSNPEIGKDIGTLIGKPDQNVIVEKLTPSAVEGVDIIIDFTRPIVTQELVHYCAQAQVSLVTGTTGMTQDEEATLAQFGRQIVVVKSGNMSLGVNLLAELVKQTAQALDKDFDIEILEMHHRMKVDAPSGTALLLGEAAAEGRQIDLQSHATRSREDITGERQIGTIGFATLRGGTVVGDHSAIFAGEHETITLSHRAESREIFAHGALKASQWAYEQAQNNKPGFYTMHDVLGF